MAKEKGKMIECVLCRKEYETGPTYIALHVFPEIDERDKVCKGCRKFWELGRQRAKSEKSEGKLGCARVKLVVEIEGREGDPEGDTVIKSADIIAAMGAVKLKGTKMGREVTIPQGATLVGYGKDRDYHASEPVEVPEARAQAMRKIFLAFHNIAAKAKVEGFNQGRNLIGALARGQMSCDEFSEQADNARAGKRPRYRF